MTEISNRPPWMIAANRVLLPSVELAELLTTTVVIGNPPISPETTLPSPLAHNAGSGGDPLLRIELVDGFQVQQRFQRGHRGSVRAAM